MDRVARQPPSRRTVRLHRRSWPGGRTLPPAARARPRTRKDGSSSGVARPRASGGRASTTTTEAGGL
eukprot:4050950-Pyramimonas_sp.AAC.1